MEENCDHVASEQEASQASMPETSAGKTVAEYVTRRTPGPRTEAISHASDISFQLFFPPTIHNHGGDQTLDKKASRSITTSLTPPSWPGGGFRGAWKGHGDYFLHTAATDPPLRAAIRSQTRSQHDGTEEKELQLLTWKTGGHMSTR